MIRYPLLDTTQCEFIPLNSSPECDDPLKKFEITEDGKFLFTTSRLMILDTIKNTFLEKNNEITSRLNVTLPNFSHKFEKPLTDRFSTSSIDLWEEVAPTLTSHLFTRLPQTNLNESSFEVNLWNAVISLLNKNKEQEALLHLFSTLNSELGNASNCDNFLQHAMNHELSSDLIVHIINALSPIKADLKNWGKFSDFSKTSLVNELGDATATRLLNVIL